MNRAPEEWEEIPAIKGSKPAYRGHKISLQKVENTNICVWYALGKDGWLPASAPYLVTGDENNLYYLN